jgi:hypothetical protein
MNRRGLSLVEILIVAAVTMIIGGLILGGTAVVRRLAQRTACANNLARIGGAMLSYKRDSDPRMYLPGDPGGWFVCSVSGLALFTLRDDYALPFAVWNCPTGRKAIGAQGLPPIEWRTTYPDASASTTEANAATRPIYKGLGLTSYAYTTYFQDAGSSAPMGWPVRPGSNDQPGSALAGDYVGLVAGSWEGNHMRSGGARSGGANHLWYDGSVTWIDAAQLGWMLLCGTRTYYLRTSR